MKHLMKYHTNHVKNRVNASIVVCTMLLLAFSLNANAQSGTSFGLKGGLNYSANGDYFESIGAAAENPDRNIGYHIGLFGQFGSSIYFRPEFVYTKTSSEYSDGNLDIQKLDAPLLVGIKVIGPLHAFGGPALQYILDSEFDGIAIDDVENDFSVGLNFGLGLRFNKFGVDVRYERGFSENEATFLNNNGIGTSRLDTRPDQLILSLAFVL